MPLARSSSVQLLTARGNCKQFVIKNQPLSYALLYEASQFDRMLCLRMNVDAL